LSKKGFDSFKENFYFKNYVRLLKTSKKMITDETSMLKLQTQQTK